MKTHDTFKEDIPDYSLPYLINADSSGLSPEDIIAIDDYMQNFYTIADEVNGFVVISTLEDESHFTWNPAFGLACNVITCNISILI